jgi:hypothetical protein
MRKLELYFILETENGSLPLRTTIFALMLSLQVFRF